ncbi:MAG: hypothetical protein QOI74_3611 [Micromonosporaceae bacterium]|nr:hypothetical protein [Micromonosporaceae bacterium]
MSWSTGWGPRYEIPSPTPAQEGPNPPDLTAMFVRTTSPGIRSKPIAEPTWTGRSRLPPVSV